MMQSQNGDIKVEFTQSMQGKPTLSFQKYCQKDQELCFSSQNTNESDGELFLFTSRKEYKGKRYKSRP